MQGYSPSNPHFFKAIYEDYESGLKIPISFSRPRMGITEGSRLQVTLRMKGKDWKVDVRKEKFVGEGWVSFVRDNRLRLGDFVVFKMKNPTLFEAMVFDGCSQMRKPLDGFEGQNMPSKNHRFYPSTSQPNFFQPTLSQVVKIEPDTEGVVGGISNTNQEDKGKSVVLMESKVDRFHSDCKYLSVGEGGKGGSHSGVMVSNSNPYPFVIAIVKQYCFTMDCLNIPLAFAREHGLCRKGYMTVLDDMNGMWKVRFLTAGDSNVRMMKGWKEFRDAKGLEEGDNIKIELVRNGMEPVVRLTVMKMM